MLNLTVLFLQYDTAKYPAAFYYLCRYLNTLKNFQINKIIIDNKKGNDYKSIDGEVTTIGHDNTLWEFGAWNKGVKYLKDNNINYDIVLFVNDSFLNPALTNLKSIVSDETIARCIKNKAFIGARGGNGEEFRLGNFKITKWIRSHCFLIERSALEKMSLTTFDLEFINKCISREASIPYFKPDAPISENLKNKVINWLGNTWHSAFKFEDDWQLFRLKTLAYFNELALVEMAKMQNINIEMIDK